VNGRGCGCAAALGFAVPLVVLLILAGAIGVVSARWATLAQPNIAGPGPASADIPADFVVLYENAARRFGLDWNVLAAVGRVETNHGRNANGCAPNSAGARGPMQFLPATFVHAAKLAGITDPDICDPADAILAAAAYLKSNGAPANWWHALYRYNPAEWYPPLVLSWAERYGPRTLVVWPLEHARLSQAFGPTALTLEPARCYEGRCYEHFHDGIDLAAPLGTSVRAIASGRVVLARRVSDGAVVVEIDHGPAVSLYGHLQPSLLVSEGATVNVGERVGRVGLTGNTTGPHLHFEVLVSGQPVDPLLVLPRR
jgi:murein DD-endopeptidase MepM/ murein hydrolase activator NlpD